MEVELEPQEDKKPSEVPVKEKESRKMLYCQKHLLVLLKLAQIKSLSMCYCIIYIIIYMILRHAAGADFTYYHPLGPGVIYPES